jgi:pimeloyl-ACP methyl ester carboxylesterase
MRVYRQLPFVCLVCILTSLIGAVLPAWPAAARPPSQPRSAAFRPADCAALVELPLGLDPGPNFECGYVTVPEQHSQPDGPSIELGVAILKSSSARPRPDPLVMAQGGPGGSTIHTYATLLLDSPLRRERDIVLFDQRGTLRSKPALLCPENVDLTLRTIEQDLGREEEQRLSDEALMQCRARLLREGANLSAYDSLENAADVEALRLALGYNQINLYGVSYGTLLALHVVRDFPGGLRSVIIDSVVPPQVNFLEQAARSENRALTEFFGACAADTRCNTSYPDLERVFYEQAQRLDRAPARVPMTDPETGVTYRAVVRGDTFQELFFQMLYSTELLPVLPQLIYDARDGRYETLGRIASLFVFERTIAEGMYFSAICAEDADFDPANAADPQLRPQIAERAVRDAQHLVELCRRWDVEPLGPAIDRPVEGDVPTLVLTGRFDPITPPAFGAQAAETLRPSYLFTFADASHGVFHSDPCADQVVAVFLNDPQTRPDDACVAAVGPPRFVAPGDALRVPSLIGLLNLERGSTTELAIFGGALLVLLSAWVVLPLAWLIRLIRGRPRASAPRLARAVPWLALLTGALLALFIVALVVGVALNLDQQALLLVGVPRELAWLFALPIVAALLTIALLAGVAVAWRSGAWSPAGRVYRSLLALAAVVCVGVLAMWGMVAMVFIR